MNEKLQKYIMECENKYIFALPQADDYSKRDRFSIIYELWGANSPVKMRKLPEKYFNAIPLFCQVKHITDILLNEGKIKLTTTNALPPKIVKQVYELGVREWMIDAGHSKLTKETDSESVRLTHIMLKIMRIIKERNGVMTLTKSGEKVVQNNQKLFEELLRDFTCKFHLAYFDSYGNESVGEVARGFSLILLSKYGNRKRSYTFYAKKYFNAFPDLLKGFDLQYSTVEAQGAICYSVRTFERFMQHFGLINIEKTQYPGNEIYITKSRLFAKMIQVLPPTQ